MSFDLTNVLVGLALLLAGFVKGASGMGFPLIATPTVALLLDIRVAITILIIPNIVMDVAQVFRGGFPLALWMVCPDNAYRCFFGHQSSRYLAALATELLPRRDGSGFCGVDLASFRVYNFTVTGKKACAASGIGQRVSQWHDKRRRPRAGHLSLQSEAPEKRIYQIHCHDFHHHQAKPIDRRFDLESL